MSQAGTVPVAFVPANGDWVETGDIGGSRFAFWSSRAFNPAGQVGASTTTQLATLSVPPTYSTMGGGSGYATMQGSATASASPWSPGKSPLPWVLVFLVVAMLGAHQLYFKKR
jgi:hypothetical protein